jgi:hypothetical protein
MHDCEEKKVNWKPATADVYGVKSIRHRHGSFYPGIGESIQCLLVLPGPETKMRSGSPEMLSMCCVSFLP